MAENPQHATTSEEHAGASREARDKDGRSVPVTLPLRQVQQPGLETKIHDITDKFIKACSSLEVGQLVKDEYFTLFESIGALEIMDPKMDGGFLQPGETLEDNYDTLKALLPEEVLGIMDQLLCHEMAWHTGNPLSQTLFTSVYIDKILWPEPKTLEQAQFYRGEVSDSRRPDLLLEVLRAYCLALIKCCDFVIAKVTSRDYFEEEDFCTHTYNRVLFVQVPIDVFLRELDVAVESLQDPDLSISADLCEAIITRLEFRKHFLTALDLDCPLEHLDRYWPPISSHLSSINSTYHLGKPVPGSFSTKIQRRLASTVPPRPIVELDFKDAFSKLQQLCLDCEEGTRFTHLSPDPLEYQSFLWAFASRTPTPLPYARSYLANILFHPNTLNTSTTLPLTDLQCLIFTCSPVLDPQNWALSPPLNPLLPKPLRHQLALIIDEFIERTGQNYLELWTALGQNRSRLRRMLNHVILGWDQLQVDANTLDEEIMAVVKEMQVQEQVLVYPLTTWVYHKKLWMIEKIVMLGFEQDIYLPDEFAGMYGFLERVARRRVDLLSNIYAHYEEQEKQYLRAKPPKLEMAAEVEGAARYIESLLAEATGVCELSGALFRFYTVLLYLRLLPTPNRPFSTPELRYELRMKPFLTLSPPEVPPFEEHHEQLHGFGPYDNPEPSLLLALQNPISELWKGIEDGIKRAKDSFSQLKKLGPKAAKVEGVDKAWGKEVQGALASCIALGVAVVGIKTAVKECDENGKVAVKVEIPEMGSGKRYAEGWVVGKVVKE